MKKKIIRVVIVLIVVITLVYLYLVFAVNAKQKELQEFKNKIEQDSIEYNSKKGDNDKPIH
ncbi:hypothetical protein [Niabella drilacis]|uniref:Uncharacterized protein n=1 Tax=Niabella drilacis (strain DSM 25811 / CCM 8410 / CCUG 62505 / LMG 26954 / E90) TaxID=1285928 RepID=A0A1G6ZDG7_NIADE|nr:hypothetical protein [Niabella drilacis]SDE00640.1 hypothetical protein SAMN04487894_1185 [Niabella drilacis]